MERTSRGGGRVWTNLNESHEMRRNGEKFSWDLKVLKIPRGETNPARFLANKCQCCPYLGGGAQCFGIGGHEDTYIYGIMCFEIGLLLVSFATNMIIITKISLYILVRPNFSVITRIN